jgi:hypothetical protein
VLYSYNEKKWNKIKVNLYKIIELLVSFKVKKPVFLRTPFCKNGNKSAYPLENEYQKLMSLVNSYCKEKNVSFLDALYILSQDNFGIDTRGKIKGKKDDILHFLQKEMKY